MSNKLTPLKTAPGLNTPLWEQYYLNQPQTQQQSEAFDEPKTLHCSLARHSDVSDDGKVSCPQRALTPVQSAGNE